MLHSNVIIFALQSATKKLLYFFKFHFDLACSCLCCMLLFQKKTTFLKTSEMSFVAGRIQRHDTPIYSCTLLNPVEGVTVRTMIECATQCIKKSDFCEGFIFSGNTGLCKLVGSLGTLSFSCNGEYYLVI